MTTEQNRYTSYPTPTLPPRALVPAPDINTAATLQGGVAQGANSSPYLFIVATLIAHLYSAAVLHGYPLPHPTSDDDTTTAQPDAPPLTVPIHLVNYADDDAGANGGPATSQQSP